MLVRHKRRVLVALYGITTAYLIALWASMFAARWFSLHGGGAQAAAAFQILRCLAEGYIGLAVFLYGICIYCVVFSYRNAQTRGERNQVRWIMWASLIASVLIAYLAGAGLHRPGDARARQCGLADVRRVASYTVAYAFSITRYKLMQVEDDHQSQRGLFRLQPYGGADLLGRALGQRQVDWRPALLESLDDPRRVAAALSVIVVLILSELARGPVSAGDRPPVLPREVQIRPGDAEDEPGRGQPDRPADAGPEAARGRGRGAAAGMGGALPRRCVRAGRSSSWRLTAPRPRNEPCCRQSARGSPAGNRHGAAFARDGARRLVRPGLRRHDRAWAGKPPPRSEARATWPGCWCWAPSAAACRTKTKRWRSWGRLSSVATLVLHSADIQETLETLNQELRGKVDKIAEQQRRILILQDQLKDRAERERELTGHRPRRASVDHRTRPLADDGLGPFETIKGSSAAVRKMIAMARKVAVTHSAVLIRGESGTGKELLAAAIHQASPRSCRPFVKLHCAALSQSLLESELFGHVKSAFTGADRDRVGRFEQANGGTLFLDEIGDINLEVQTKLLRVLQEMSFERVGSSQPITVDVRILAATHQDLEALIRAGRFREDLYYRLNVILPDDSRPARAPGRHLRAGRVLLEPARRAHRQAGHAPGPGGRRGSGGL